MGYTTFHEALDQDQAEQEGITMGDLMRQISKEEFEELERLRAKEIKFTKAGKLSTEELDKLLDIRAGVLHTITTDELYALNKFRNFLSERSIKATNIPWDEVSGLIDESLLAVDREQYVMFREFKSLWEDLPEDERHALIELRDGGKPTLDEIRLLIDMRAGKATIIREGDLHLGELSVVDNSSDPFLAYLLRTLEWSTRTFGPAARTNGIINHMRKEIGEIEKSPYDLTEWIDMIKLAIDGYWRHGGNLHMLLELMCRKQRKNFARAWPDWRTMSEDDAIEHDRSQDAPSTV